MSQRCVHVNIELRALRSCMRMAVLEPEELLKLEARGMHFRLLNTMEHDEECRKAT